MTCRMVMRGRPHPRCSYCRGTGYYVVLLERLVVGATPPAHAGPPLKTKLMDCGCKRS